MSRRNEPQPEIMYPAAGIEGVVAKGAATTYRGGVRGWQKSKHRTTEEAVSGP